jgi:hypothetical protein
MSQGMQQPNPELLFLGVVHFHQCVVGYDESCSTAPPDSNAAMHRGNGGAQSLTMLTLSPALKRWGPPTRVMTLNDRPVNALALEVFDLKQGSSNGPK